VFERDKGVCRYCPGIQTIAWEDGVFEHVLPFGRGGQTEIENGVWSCRPCNKRLGDRLEEKVALGLLSLRNGTPTLIPENVQRARM